VTRKEATAAGATAKSKHEPERLLLHMPVDVRNAALVVIAVLISVFALQWARAVFIPLLLGVMLSYALTPAVDLMQRWRVPRAAAAGLLLSAIVDSLPQVAQKLRQTMQGQRQKPVATIEKVQQAAAEIEQVADSAATASAASDAASGAASAARPPTASASATRAAKGEPMATALPTPRGVTRVVVEKPGLNIRDYLWTGTLGAFALLGQAAVVFFITFFLLASGDSFRRKMAKLAGPRLSQKRITVQAMDEITQQIQRYLLVQLAVSTLVGVLTWLVFMAIGLEQSAVWGVVAGVTNLIPYLGAILVGGASALVGFIQFGALDMGVLVGASSFAIHTVVGNLLTPWLMGRAGRMSPFAVFVSVLAFGWLWGVWGLLLGVPILMVVKAICDRVDELNAIGELLGD
jgi:predicted PurR-regulated permease PerM